MKMHLNNGFCKQSHCYYIHTDEDCENHLQGEKCRYSKCIDIEGQTGRDKDKQEQKGTNKDRQGQTGTDKDKQGPTGGSTDKHGQKGAVPVCPCLSLFVLAFSLFVPALSLIVPAMYLAMTGIIGK